MTAEPLTLATRTDAQPTIRLLGGLWVSGNRTPTAGKQRTLLAVLVFNVGTWVPTTKLIDELWEDGSLIRSAKTCVETYIHQLRKRFQLPVTSGHLGYQLDLAPDEVDVLRFRRFVSRARAAYQAGDPFAAMDLLRAAASLWQGAPLEDVQCGRWLRELGAEMEDSRQAAVELGFAIALATGRHREILDDLRREWRHNMVREDIAAQLMIALYRSQRQVDALKVFAATQHALREDYGLDPGPVLERLQQQILAGENVELEA